MRLLRRHYGAGPFHLFGLLACFAVAAYAVTRVLGASGWKGIFLWFAICLIVHDLIAWPLYTLADRALRQALRRQDGGRELAVPWVNHIRVPVIISGTLLGMFFPLIFRLSQRTYTRYTGFNENVYLVNWLGVTAVLFAVSGAIYVLRLVRSRWRGAPANLGPSVPTSDSGNAG